MTYTPRPHGPAYYNELDPQAAAWLRGLIAEGLIAPGVVDERSITDVRAAELVGFRQVHFFAGIGGWSLALRLAGIPDDAPIWTGSCPCQGLSVAGRRGMHTDDWTRFRAGSADPITDPHHLWPHMQRLVAECRPPAVFGEQTASADGRTWLAAVRADLEDLGYAVGAADLCAAGVGAPHVRQRLFWGGLANAGRVDLRDAERADDDGTARAPEGDRPQRERVRVDARSGGGCAHGRLANAGDRGLRPGAIAGPQQAGRAEPDGRGGSRGGHELAPRPAGLDAWRDHGWVECADGRSRPTAPLARRVDDGVPARVGLLRGCGNAIVPQLAAAFVMSLLEAAS